MIFQTATGASGLTIFAVVGFKKWCAAPATQLKPTAILKTKMTVSANEYSLTRSNYSLRRIIDFSYFLERPQLPARTIAALLLGADSPDNVECRRPGDFIRFDLMPPSGD